MDIVIYFIENGIDWGSLVILVGVLFIFEVFSEIVAELVARPLMNKVKSWYRKDWRNLGDM